MDDELRTLTLRSVMAISDKQVMARLVACVGLYGIDTVRNWSDPGSKNGNNLLHAYIYHHRITLLEWCLEILGCDVNVQRKGDLNTPLHLAAYYKNKEATRVLIRFGADVSIKNKYGEVGREVLVRDTNIAWVDLEMSALPGDINKGLVPDIIECAIIVTDKDLREIARKNWIIHFEQEDIDKMGAWQRGTFASVPKGNGLLAESLASTLTKQQFEDDFLSFVKALCVEKVCPLAGSSIQNDRDMFLLRHPKIFDFFSFRIIDTSTLLELSKRWAPSYSPHISHGSGLLHRAMADVERSIGTLQAFRETGFALLR
jgi:oligoribonuclease